MALLQLPLKAKAGAGSGFSFPAAASRPARIACDSGGRGAGAAAVLRLLARRPGGACAPWARSRGESRCLCARRIRALPARRQHWRRAGQDTGCCAVVCARRAGGALFCHTEVAHLAPSTAGLNFVPAQVPLSRFSRTCRASVQMFATSMALGFELIKLCIPVGSL